MVIYIENNFRNTILNIGSYISVMYYCIKRVGEKEHLIGFFPNEFNKFNNTGARMQGSIYHMTLKSHFISNDWH